MADTILQTAKQRGTRSVARALISQTISATFGITIDDLPDSRELGAYVDEMEQLIEKGISDGCMPRQAFDELIHRVMRPDVFAALVMA